MIEKQLKPMLSPKGLIENLKTENIKFKEISEKEAEYYLTNYGNYHLIKSYKENFERYYIEFIFINKYVDLDFAYLKDLFEIDYEVRVILFKIIINIEHNLKMKLLNIIENQKKDIYKVINKYLKRDFNDEKRLHNSIYRILGKENYKNFIVKYNIKENNLIQNIPIWELLEIITFGELVKLYDFILKEYNIREKVIKVDILRDIVKLRNSVRHNNLVLSN